MRWVAGPVFALAVAGSTLAGSGLVVAPHVEPPGTPRFHDHVVSAYRFPLFALRMTERLAPGPGFEQLAPAAELAPLVLALLVVLTPRLARPTRYAIARLTLVRVHAPQWRADAPHAPPRTAALPASA